MSEATLSDEQLRTRLSEKEELVCALTERLERAAEQLDRLRRSGADRGPIMAGGGIPPELVAAQQELTTQLQEAVQQWENLQVSVSLGRVEMQLAELRDLIVTRLVTPGPSPTPSRPASHAAAPATQTSRQPTSVAAVLARMGLSEAGEEQEQTKSPAAHSESSSRAAEPGTVSVNNEDFLIAESPRDSDISPEIPEAPLPEPPDKVDLEQASREELRAAVAARDEYITALLEHVEAWRSTKLPAAPPLKWEELPQTQRLHLEAWEERLQQKYRRTEIELSIERARLSREELQLHHQREQVHKEMKRLGLVKEGGPTAPPKRTASRTGWFGLLNKPRPADAGEETE